MPKSNDELLPEPARTSKEQDDLQQELRRIAAALEKGNEIAKKKGADKEGGEQAEEGGESEKKEGKGKGKDSHKPSKKVVIIGVIVLLVVIGLVIFLWLRARGHVSTDDAYTTGHVHQVSSRITGTVESVEVDDNQIVEQGQVIVRLDTRDNIASRDQAAASLAQAEASAQQARAQVLEQEADLTQSQAAVAQQRAQVDQYEAQRDTASITYERNLSLYKSDARAISKSDVDNAEGQLKSAQAQVDSANANLAAAQSKVHASEAMVTAAKAKVQVEDANAAAAKASLASAELQLSYCHILAPVRGKISKKTVEAGQRLSAGQALLSVVPDEVWVIANLKETQLEHVQVGQRVDIEVDALSHQTFVGTVDSIQEGTGATFSLLPADNATGNFTKIVQRVPVKIVFDEDSVRDCKDKIVPGLSVEPKIDLTSSGEKADSHGAKKREEKRQKEKDEQNRKKEEGKL